MTSNMIPVTLLTGFLGAGKTTLLNHILHGEHGHRIAVIENEFGPAGIDGELLAQKSASIVEMTNGCLCCTMLGELTDNLMALQAQREAGLLDFDRVIIETTGLASPTPLVGAFFSEPLVSSFFLLDAVITVVDALHGGRQLDEQPVLQEQVGLADRLLLSKTDLATPDDVEALRDRLAAINPRATVCRLDCGRIDLADVLDLRAFNFDESLPALSNGRHAHHHSDEVGSLLLEHPGSVDLDGISSFMQDMLDRHGDDLLRYKGVLSIPEQPAKLVFQGVHRTAGFDYGNPWQPEEERRSRIVVIGRRLPMEELREGFAQCLLAA